MRITSTFAIRLRRSERSLERLLGLVGRRGHDVESLRVEPDAGGWFAVVLTLVSERPPDVLARQIAKLYDVESVSLSR